MKELIIKEVAMKDEKSKQLSPERMCQLQCGKMYTRVYRMAENLGFRVVTTKKNTQLLAFKGDINDR